MFIVSSITSLAFLAMIAFSSLTWVSSNTSLFFLFFVFLAYYWEFYHILGVPVSNDFSLLIFDNIIYFRELIPGNVALEVALLYSILFSDTNSSISFDKFFIS